MTEVKSVLKIMVLFTWFSIHVAGFELSESQCVGRPLDIAVKEGLTAGTVLFKFKHDENIHYTFHKDLYSRPALGMFQISSTGIVTNIVTLDHEDKRGSQFSLTLLAKTNNIGKDSWTNACSLTITILDLNDNSPVFKKDLYVGYIDENLPKGSVVQGLHGIYATDLDAAANSVHSYKILPGNGADKFEAETEELSGVKFLNIRSKVKLDREESSFYVLTVQALDGGKPQPNARTQIRINIGDTNDCSPKFKSSEYFVTILSSTPVSTSILKLHAQDDDMGENAEIYYFFKKFQTKSPNDNSFTLDPYTGVLRVARRLDFTSGNFIRVTVVAQDRGNPARRAETVVIVRLYRGKRAIQPVKLSTQALRFTKSSYLLRIREDLPINSHILHSDVINLARSKYRPKFSISSHKPIPFEVDANSGVLYLVKSLDFETESFYEFQLIITSSQKSIANVTVLIDDADENFHKPVFDKANIATKFNRNWKMSHLVEKVKAIDPDEGPDGTLNYYIDDGDAVGKFSIDQNTGRVDSVAGLNWNGLEQLELVVEVRDSASKWKSAKQFLLISVVGQEDCTPLFERTEYTGNILENLPRGSFVVVTKAQVCQGNSVVYSITDGNSRNQFTIDKESGIVSTTKILNREERDQYTLEITATNGSTHSKALVVINIDDVNDNDPVFVRKNYQVEITENRGKITSLLCLTARDKDYGNNAKIKYDIVSGNKNLFYIDDVTGTLSSESLNFEDSREHKLTVRATDHGNPPRFSHSNVEVVVKNINDPPKFESNEVTVSIVEEQPIKTRVTFLSVVDEDVGRNGEFECSYENIDPLEFGKFQVLSTSNGCEVQNVVLLKWLEKSSYSLRVRVTDRAPLLVQKSDVITLRVKIEDVNNNDPVFTQDSYWSSVSPGSTSILTVTATDQDSERNARIRYSLKTKSKIFHIHSTSGKLTAFKSRLRVGKHVVGVYAEDQGSPRRRTKVTCYVSVDRSINRFPPKISMSKQKPEIYENVGLNTLVTTVYFNKAQAKVKYDIVGGNAGGAFGISENGEVRVVSSLDYEKVEKYKLVVRITYKTSGGRELAREAPLNIQILDINDNEPIFLIMNKPLVINVNRRIHSASLITKISAYDADLADTVTYKIKSSSSVVPFKINAISGEVTARNSVQSRMWRYSFTVIAEDRRVPKKHDELEVHVRILWASPSLNISDDQLVGNVDEGFLGVGKDIMTFKNVGEHYLTYAIVKGNVDYAFCIDVTGSLYAARELDREHRANYILSVSADDGEISETSVVTINVNDINDNRPQFSDDVISIFTEENRPAQKIWTFTARDWDLGMNSNVTYGIVGTSKQSSSNIFVMDNGILMITRVLDHEEAPKHMLTIVAKDQGSPSYKTVAKAVVHVTDRNDNAPRFLSRGYVQRVLLNAPRGYLILRTMATDKDSGLNGKIKYTIHPLSTMFSIDESTGWISVSSVLAHGSLAFNVTATDHGTPRLSDMVPVTITVEISAGPPRFIHAGFPSGFHASVRENEASGTKVMRLTAVSKDLVTYNMYQTNITEFTIDPISGAIFTTKPLDFEDIKYYEFAVSATDRSERMDVAHVRISVVNINDEKPRILNKNNNNEISCRISRDAAVGSLLMKIEAQDDDYIPLKYSLTQSLRTVLFHIDAAGSIRTVGSLRDIKDRVYLAVTVRDSWKLELEDTVTINVVVVNYGTNLVSMSAEISEDTDIGTVIPVSRKIPPRYKNPQYTIIYPLQSPFTIHTTQGKLSLRTKLDYEVQRTYSLTVRLQESGNKNDHFDVDIKIDVKDINDNQPEFVSPADLNGCKNRPKIKIHENAERGTLVYKFKARDKDSGRNGEVLYRIEKSCQDCTDLFFLDENSGVLKTVGVELRKPRYEVNVEAYDKGTPTKSSRACIILEADQWRPEFTKAEYRFIVDESAVIDQRVGIVKAQGFGVTVTYELQNTYFSLDPSTGELTVISSLDYEKSNERRIEFEVATRNQASKAKVIVHVRDVNDCAPKFDKSIYMDYIPETAPVGSTVLKLHASDGDSGLNADIRYSLDDKDFIVDSYTGVVSTASLLDFETTRAYSITVTAHDRGSPSLEGKVQVLININNVNDNQPIFTSQEYSCRVWENAQPGSELTTVKATDADGDKLTYDITSGNSAAIFIIDQDSGVLKLTNDHLLVLVGPYYIINISATDGVYWGYSMVRVNIMDINDHAPVFKKCGDYHPSIPEDSPLRTTVLQVSATDDDLGSNGQVEYAIVRQEHGTMFGIESTTGRIETKTKFDREKERKFSMLVKATDGNDEMKPEERLEGSCSIEVTITDVNDNKPVFERNSYALRINENVEISHQILKVSANDADEGENATITYSLKKPSSLFSIHPQTGVIQTQTSLIKRKNKYILKILATDHGHLPLFSEVDVTINIIESNDGPEFKQSFYEVKIPENFTKLSMVTRVTATSKNPNFQVWHSIVKGNNPGTNSLETFKIDPNGVVTLSDQLDRETIPIYTLTIRAKTMVEQFLTSFATLRIVLDDVNDCRPKFERSDYKGVVSENTVAGTSVLKVSATDSDLNSDTVYSILNRNKNFTIDSKTGLIRTKRVFDREKQDYYSFIVKATDKENSALSSDAFVMVVIADVNDLPPVFESKHYSISVKENEVYSTVKSIGAVTASDGDRRVNAKITYSIRSGNIDGNFRVDPDNGLVFVNGNLDYEVRRKYELVLGAWDGKHKDSTRVTITVEDVNDNTPTFEYKLHEASVLENSPKGTNITILKASDPDSKWITYKLSDQVRNVFEIDSKTGEIRTNMRLDREVKDKYIFEAYAIDHDNKTGPVKVQIHVVDVNDNAPTFLKTSLKMSVLENQLPGTVVGRVQASDLDDVTSGNGRVRYRIIMDPFNAFTINRNTGVLNTSIVLDRENRTTYKLKVTATDNGTPSKSTIGDVIITVLDVNDNKPRFSRKVYEKTIAENVSVGMSILQLAASDRDIGMNANLSFAMVRNNYIQHFELDSRFGKINVAAPLDYEKETEYTFDVKVEDGGNQRLSDLATVIVRITDSNDCPPVFRNDRTYNFDLDEGVYKNKKLGTKLVANDEDRTKENRELRYSIRKDASDSGKGFVINPITGQLFVNTTLDFEQDKVHRFKVRATNIAFPYLFGESSVVLKVKDINDNPPELAPSLHDLKISENSNVNGRETLVKILSATDEDKEPNGKPFTFGILRGNEKNLFRLDGKGDLTTVANFDREEQALYVLEIWVRDSGTPPLTNNITVRIHVTDRNDNQHKEGYLELSVNIFDQQSISSAVPVGRVFVNDSDTNDLRYYDVLTGDSKTFTINRNTGDIFMNKRPTGKEYNFRVKVSDRSSDFHPVECQVKINVNIIPSEAFSKSITLKFLNKTAADIVTNLDMYRELLAETLNTIPQNVDIFNIQNGDRYLRDIDVRLAAHGSPYYAPEVMISILKGERNRLKKHFQNFIVGYDACAVEHCKTGGCRSRAEWTGGMRIVSNGLGKAFGSVEIKMNVMCGNCKELFPAKISCKDKPCLNSGLCKDIPGGYLCTCDRQYQGPNCELNTRSFKPGDWVWLRALKSCRVGTLSLEFSTLRENGLLLYAGPTANFGPGDTFDFIAVQLYKGRVRVKMSLGNKNPSILHITKSKKLNDGEWHLVEIHRNATFIRLVIDQCNSSLVKISRAGQKEDRSNCEKTMNITNTKYHSLNINDPVQLGGMLGSPPDFMDVRPLIYDGCIRNVKENGVMMDLKDVSNSKGSQEGCPIIDRHCPSLSPCSRNASCVASRKGFTCVCLPGIEGSLCRNDSVQQTFNESSSITYRPRSSFLKTYNPKFTEIQMMIRTRNKDGGPLLMIRDKLRSQRLTLRLISESNGSLCLEGNVKLGHEDTVVKLRHTLLGDGRWHHVTISRYRNEVYLGIDVNNDPRTAKGLGHPSFIQFEISRETEIIIGSTGPGNGFDGCIKDVRLNGETLHHDTSNKVAMMTKYKEIRHGCYSGACDGNTCHEHEICDDQWRLKKCLQRLCLKERLCLNGAKCVDYPKNGVAMYKCECQEGFNGSKCESGSQIIRLSADEEVINVKLVIGLSCFVLVLVLVTLLIICYHRHQTNGKATFDRKMTLSDLDKKKQSSKKSLVVEWLDEERNKANNSIKNLLPSKHFIKAHVHNTRRPSSVPVKTHPLEPEVTENKRLSQLPAWDIPPMIELVLSPDSDSSVINDDYIEDPDETWQDAESNQNEKPTVAEQSQRDVEPDYDDSKLPAVTWIDIEEYGRKFYKITRDFLARDNGTRPGSGVSTTSNSSSVITVVENPQA